MAAAARTKKKGSFRTTLLVTLLIAAPLLAAPPLIRGLAAEAWTRHYESLPEFPRPHRATARTLVEKTDLAVRNLAPLPMAAATAIRALEIGQRIESVQHDPETALLIYQGVRATCAAVRQRPFSGAGLSVIEARAAALEDAARKASPK
jgi:hypothetical protein